VEKTKELGTSLNENFRDLLQKILKEKKIRDEQLPPGHFRQQAHQGYKNEP
jgi:hypothetical protein